MSLINEMLQDLDRSEPAHPQPLPSGLTSGEKLKSASLRRLLLPGLASLALAYALLVEWNLLGFMPEKTSGVADIPQPIALNSKWLNQNSEANLPPPVGIEAPVKVAPVTEPSHAIGVGQDSTIKIAMGDAGDAAIASQASAISMPDAAVDQLDEQMSFADAASPNSIGAVYDDQNLSAAVPSDSAINQLLLAAEHARLQDRLTTPVGDNAFQLYRSILLLDPQNFQAIEGIDLIRQRYLTWLQSALEERRLTAARHYWHKAKSVGTDAEILASFDNALREAEDQTQSSQEEVVPVAPTVISAVVMSDEEVAQRVRSQGLGAEKDVFRWLQQSNSAQQTVVALTDLYVQRQSSTDLQRLGLVLNERNEPASAYVTAQLHLLEGNDQLAMKVLSNATFSGAAEQQRLRLLAGLQQKAGQFSAAMAAYSSLVTLAPKNVSDWLGLAVSADRSQLSGTALSAYEQVLALRHPDPRVMRYALQRQQDLSVSKAENR